MRLLQLTFLTLISLYNTASAQNCKWVKEKTDPFTKAVVRTAGLYIRDSWEIRMERRGEEYFVGLNIYMTGLINEKLEAGQKIIFKLGDDKIYELVLDKDYEPILIGGGGGAATNWHVLVKIPRQEFKQFAKRPVTAIRTTIHNEEKTQELGERAGGKIMDTFACMLQD